ncbi:predicted protein [Haematococcus lacustris]|uniref:DUF4743 domain-containing protein n=1 Tax=Haematococcus lacustris TaxID=44745 RepID=A0A6A0A8Y7_HAELA|nr:predicted protein [Haematococcus lacustris]
MAFIHSIACWLLEGVMCMGSPSQAQKNKKASGEARRDRHDKNTWHGKKCKLHTLMTGAMPATLDGFLQRIAENNTGLDELPTLIPFMVADVVVGHMKPKFAAELARFPDVFVTTASTSTSSSLDAPGGVAGLKSKPALGLNPGLATLESRTEAVAGVLAQLRGEGLITGWRDELYPVTPSYYAAPLMLVERAAATHFGIKAYGVHVNGPPLPQQTQLARQAGPLGGRGAGEVRERCGAPHMVPGSMHPTPHATLPSLVHLPLGNNTGRLAGSGQGDECGTLCTAERCRPACEVV